MGIACGKSSLTLNNINMAPKNILITGGNRGIGLQLVKEFLKTSPDHLFATCRDPSKADDLNALAKDRNWYSVFACRAVVLVFVFLTALLLR